MYIPSEKVGGWGKNLIDECSVSLRERVDRGVAFRNLYLTGDMDGDSAIYNKCFSHIETLSSQLYSPVELRFIVDYYGYASPVHKAMAYTATNELQKQVRGSNSDIRFGSAVTWSLVKGNTFVKLLWGKNGLEPYVIQPEMMGVHREDINDLDKQEAFFQSTYYTSEAFYNWLSTNPDKEDIFKKVGRFYASKENSPARDSENAFKRIILSGLYPMGSSDASSPSSGSRNIVDWMGSPAPSFSPRILQSLIRLDELWVRDDEREDYTTIQLVGDNVVSGKNTNRNIFADAYDPDNKKRNLPSDDDNPLSGTHPYIEVCPNPLEGYAWGRSELCNVALVQEAINKRVNGIGALLRRQEDPNFLFTGMTSSAKDVMAKIKKPGGHLVEQNPGATAKALQTDLPKGLFDTLHEYLGMFESMSGLTSTVSGQGEAGVRSANHAETLVRMGSPRLKDCALTVERQLEQFGGLALDLMKAKVAKQMTAWVMPKESMTSKLAAMFAKFSEEEFIDPPVHGMKPINFLLSHLPSDCKVSVDSHSSSAAFSADNRQLIMELAKFGAIDAEHIIEHLHPPGAASMQQALVEKKIEQAEFQQQHPEIAAEQMEKAAKKKKK
jgi:hypothetical protein